MAHIEWEVTGMTCGGCVSRLKKVLDATDGVESVEVNLDAPQVKLDFDSARVDEATLREAIEDTGFAVAHP